MTVGGRAPERTPAWRGFSITISVFVAMIVIAVLLAGALIVYNHRSNAAAALVAADQLMAEVAETVLERVVALGRPVGAIADMAPSWSAIGDKPDFLGHPVQAQIERSLETYPQISSIYMGYDDGDFFQVHSLVEVRAGVRTALDAPAEARFSTRLIFRRPDGRRVELWKYLDADRRIVGSRVVPGPGYDPRERPWYGAAIESTDLIRTDPYVFESTGTIGMTAARRFDGVVPGVVGVDVKLGDLSNFLEEQRPAAGGLIMLFRPDGRVLAHPDADRLWFETEDGSKRLARVDDLGDSLAVALHHALADASGRLPDLIEVDGRRYVGRVQRLPVRAGSDELLGIAVPVEAFTSRIAAIGRESVVISVVIVLALLPLIWLLSRQISRPLLRLVGEVEAIREFRLDQPIELRSHIREVQQLADSMGQMKAGLRTFGLYLPKALVRRMVETGTEPVLGGERQEITVLFTDVARFTDLSEGMAPEVLMHKISGYFEELTGVLMAHGATIDKYMGDAIMAFWNAPVPDDDHVARACRAALATRAANDQLDRAWVAAGEPAMSTRFGLHVGEAVVGNVGSSDRMNYTVIGATVNLGSRLEGLNKNYGTRILVSEAVAARVGGRFLLRTVDKVIPKGIAEPIRIHELIGSLEATDMPEGAMATPDDRAWRERWEAAYDAYLDRRWEAALGSFRSLAEERPHDAVAALYVARTERLIAEPPGADWAGVETYASK